jgi:NAD+ diphosphatase
MMVLITRGSEILLARAPRFPAGMFSALAGFVEPGETIEDCIRREVREEVGLEVGGIRYFRQPVVGVPHSLMIAYTAEYAGRRAASRTNGDRRSAMVLLDAVPNLPPSISISRG